MSEAALDNAAAAALYALEREKPPAFEHLGLLYSGDAGLQRTPTASKNARGEVKGRFNIPAGSLRGLFHNHPVGAYENSSDGTREKFSTDDVEQAKRLRVPSYIAAGDKVLRYDPATGKTEEVLAEFPTEEHRRWLMAKILMRAPDDPRGPYR